MADPNPVTADPTPAPAPEPLSLAELYSACFDWEHPRPLKINIHQDLIVAGHDRAAVKRALGRYCKADRYRQPLQAGAPRLDLQGQPAGAVTEREAAQARSLAQARAALSHVEPEGARRGQGRLSRRAFAGGGWLGYLSIRVFILRLLGGI